MEGRTGRRTEGTAGSGLGAAHFRFGGRSVTGVPQAARRCTTRCAWLPEALPLSYWPAYSASPGILQRSLTASSAAYLGIKVGTYRSPRNLVYVPPKSVRAVPQPQGHVSVLQNISSPTCPSRVASQQRQSWLEAITVSMVMHRITFYG